MPEALLAAEQNGQKRHFLTFRLDDRLYALPADDIAEVIRVPAVARMPQSPAALMGLANLRGSILPVASGRGLLGQAEAITSENARAIVMHGASPVALAVDAVMELVELSEDDIENRQAELPGEMLKGAFQPAKGGQVIKLLDIKGLLNAAFVVRARTQGSLKRQNTSDDFLSNTIQAESQTKLVAFSVAGQEYALPLEMVREIVSAPTLLAEVPHSEALVLGVATLRDALLPLLSLRGLLGFTRGSDDREREKVVVVMVEGNPVGLVVDEMRTIFAADESRMEPIPKVLAARSGGESQISAIYRRHDDQGLVSILEPQQLFGEEVMVRLGAARESAESSDGTVQAFTETRQFLVFSLGDEEFGLPIESVEEVARVPEQITRVPNTPKFLEGVVNLRGEVVPVVDQRKRFNMPKMTEDKSRRLIVVRTERHIAALIVDSVSEVLRSDVDEIDTPPDLTGETTRLVQGVINLEQKGRIVLLLDPSELLTRAERGLLDKFGKQQSAQE